MQLSLLDEAKIDTPKAGNIIEECPPVSFIPNFLAKPEADELMSLCLAQMEWQQNQIKMFDKIIPLPRLEAIAAKKALTYTYSGSVKLEAKPLPKFLDQLMGRVEQESGYLFDLVIGNHYRTGDQYIGWHADKEPLMGDRPAIASISLGAERKFQLRKNGANTRIHEYHLPHGSLLIMHPGCQQEWIHQLPKSKKIREQRVNLTFRPWQA